MNNGASSSETLATTPFPKTSYAWFVVFALSFTNLVSYIERSLVTLLIQPIKEDFSLTDTEVSLLAGFAFVIFYVLFGFYFGRLADRRNRKWIITLGIVFWSLATVCCSFARNFWQFFFARVSVGVGESTLGSAAISLLSDYFPRARLARALSVYTGAQYIGAGAALIVGGAALQLATSLPPLVLPFVGEFQPWQTTFLIVGVGGSIVFFPMLFVREPIRRGFIPGSKAAPEAEAGKKGVPFIELWAFIRSNPRTFSAFFLGFPINSIIGFGVAAWMPTYFIRNFGWSPQEIGYLYGMIVAGLGFLGVISGGFFLTLLEKMGYRDSYLRLPLITVPITMAFQIMVPFMPTAELALLVLSISVYLSPIPLAGQTAGMQVITPNPMRGQIASIYLFAANIIGLAIGPTLVALITDFVYRDEYAVSYSVATVSLICSPLVWLTLFFAIKHFRKSLDDAAAWSGNK